MVGGTRCVALTLETLVYVLSNKVCTVSVDLTHHKHDFSLT